MESPYEWFQSELACATKMQEMLIDTATGGGGDGNDYQAIRKRFLANGSLAPLTPSFVRACRDLNQFWGFIKGKFGTYAERREYLWTEFRPLFDHLEGHDRKPADETISSRLKRFDADGVHAIWTKAIERRVSDPDGAITTARTLLETVCKHVLDAQVVEYDLKADLPALYALTAKSLNLAPSQHTEETFKKILGGVTSVVTELGSLRNRLGDAHGQGRQAVRPSERHAALAVNLAGSIALFIVDTFNARIKTEAKPS